MGGVSLVKKMDLNMKTVLKNFEETRVLEEV